MPQPKYARPHQRARRAALAAVIWGVSLCPRCAHPLERGDRVDLDHRDDGEGYNGLAHSSPCRVCGERCNQAAGGRKSAQAAGYQLRQRRCVICGLPYQATSGSAGATQATCGGRSCIAALRRHRRSRLPDPPPPPATGRSW